MPLYNLYIQLHYITYISAGFLHEILVCMNPGYRGHGVPLVCGWGQRGGVMVG
jgi:hypothetical protein